ncbi:MAG: dihydrofolate reductase family protein, partial [Candidatus Delongbacteria bacterium]
PELTVRSARGRDPVRIIIDENLDLSIDHKVFRKGAQTVIITSSDTETSKETIYEQKGITVFRTANNSGFLDIGPVLKELYRSGIRSIMVEGGGTVFEYMLKNKLVNRVNIFIAPKLIGSGKRIFANSKFKTVSDCISLNVTERSFINEDIFIDALLEYRS